MELWLLLKLVNETMPEGLTLYQILVLGSGLVGLYIKIQIDLNNIKTTFNAEIGKLEVRQKAHESQTEEIKNNIKKLLDAVDEIKLLLARNQLDK